MTINFLFTDRVKERMGKSLTSNTEKMFERSSVEVDDASSVISDCSDWQTSSDNEQSDSATSCYEEDQEEDDGDDDEETQVVIDEDLMDLEELTRLRYNSVHKLRTSWEHIIHQYGARSEVLEQSYSINNSQISLKDVDSPTHTSINMRQPWKPAHTVVPPLERFQGSAGMMIAPEWQILPIEETGEVSEDEDIIDFESYDWENEIQNTSYFDTPVVEKAKIRQHMASPIVHKIDLEIAKDEIKRRQKEQIALNKYSSPLLNKTVDQKILRQPDSKKRKLREVEMPHKETKIRSKKEIRRFHSRDQRDSNTSIDNYFNSQKHSIQLSSKPNGSFSSACQGRGKCEKSFCLMCGNVRGIGSGLPSPQKAIPPSIRHSLFLSSQKRH